MIETNKPTNPTIPTQRLVAIDLLRGFALLGILVMNIQSFSMPDAAYFNPTAYGDLTGLNYAVWALSHLFADQKFMTLFSILFGAGIVLMSSKLEEKGRPSRGIHYRRNFWLLVIGMAHAYLLWSGDILVAYALCAFIVYWCRNWPPRRQLIVGLLLFIISPLLLLASGASMAYAPPEALAEFEIDWQPTAEMIQADLAAYQGGWVTQMSKRVPSSIESQTMNFFFWALWRAGGLMLIGMALYKWGVLTAKRSRRFYTILAVIGFAVGLPIIYYGITQNFAHDWAFLYSFFGVGSLYNYLASLFVSLGYIGLVMLLAQSNLFKGLQNALAAVGRMAMTNYLLHTIIATTLFYGHGLGLYGTVERSQQILFVVAIWIAQLILSPIWLRTFRFGPFEWFWRSLTYWQIQPFRNR